MTERTVIITKRTRGKNIRPFIATYVIKTDLISSLYFGVEKCQNISFVIFALIKLSRMAISG